MALRRTLRRRAGSRLRLAALDGRQLDRSLRLVLPRSTWELEEWGRRLGNCLADYRSSAVAGRSIIIGVEASGRLRYCIELNNRLSIRQFLGPRNHIPDPQDEAVVLAALASVIAPRPGLP